MAKSATFGVKWASDESFCPSTVQYGAGTVLARETWEVLEYDTGLFLLLPSSCTKVLARTRTRTRASGPRIGTLSGIPAAPTTISCHGKGKRMPILDSGIRVPIPVLTLARVGLGDQRGLYFDRRCAICSKLYTYEKIPVLMYDVGDFR